MRALYDIFRGTPNRREIVFEEGEWCIYRRERERYNGPEEVLILIHRCKRADYNHAMQLPKGKIEKCEACQEVTPNDIKTLYILSTWDQL